MCWRKRHNPRMALNSSKKVCGIVFGLLFLVTIGLLAGFFGVFLHSFPTDCHQSPHGQVDSLRDKVCLECGLLQRDRAVKTNDVDETDQLVFVDKFDVGTQELCCVDAISGLRHLFDIFPAERQRVVVGAILDCEPTGDNPQNKSSSRSDDSPRSKATAAHMFLDIDSLWDGVLGFKWSIGDSDATGFLAGVKYIPQGNGGGSLSIPRDGIYFVYSSFRFDSYYNRTLQRRSQTHFIVSHSLRRNSKNVSNEILQFGNIQVQAGTLKESYLSRNIQLKKGDELFVFVSDVSLIYSFPMSNVFGLYEV